MIRNNGISAPSVKPIKCANVFTSGWCERNSNGLSVYHIRMNAMYAFIGIRKTISFLPTIAFCIYALTALSVVIIVNGIMYPRRA